MAKKREESAPSRTDLDRAREQEQGQARRMEWLATLDPRDRERLMFSDER